MIVITHPSLGERLSTPSRELWARQRDRHPDRPRRVPLPDGLVILWRVSESPLFRKVDCLSLPVPDLDHGLEFYQRLGHQLIWRSPTRIGLRLPDSDAELVLQVEHPDVETDLVVGAVGSAVQRFLDAGGRVVVPPFDIAIGLCAVVVDPWGNRLVMLDTSKGFLATDEAGNVTGVVS